METKTSKAQEEIWEAKERLYQETKDFPMEKKLEYFHEKAKKIIDEYFKDRVIVH